MLKRRFTVDNQRIGRFPPTGILWIGEILPIVLRIAPRKVCVFKYSHAPDFGARLSRAWHGDCNLAGWAQTNGNQPGRYQKNGTD
jgi:hypothetical protein